MQVVTHVEELKQKIRVARAAGQTIGVVPTMGYLHEGHLTLMRRARAEQGFVIATLFVNPLQFGPQEDFAVYPRDLNRDSALAETTGIDLLFAPSVDEMYPAGNGRTLTFVDVEKITTTLCGASRPGHFRGVATVVTKLFNLTEADTAYFGQKDAQQVAVIRRMIEDLNMNVKIVAVPIVREPDGLALSSRNQFLSPAERKAGLVLSRSLNRARELLMTGERDVTVILATMDDLIRQEPLAVVDYISIVDTRTLEPIKHLSGAALIALAVRFGKTRLIDNLLWEEK
ncbi:MAG TPA: pantoate--beta-alanine ligase [Negativicutes bacterium]|nr:pantoate--beta-alanine ligase [Negativicutes bacterium]